MFESIDSLHKSYGAEFSKKGEFQFPYKYSKGISKELEHLLKGTAILDCKISDLIEIRGKDAATFLQGVITNDIYLISKGSGQSNLLCDNKGKILYSIEIICLSTERYILICLPGEANQIGRYLNFFHIQEEIEMLLITPDLIRLDTIGPKSEEALNLLGYCGDPLWTWNNKEIITTMLPLGCNIRFVNIIPHKHYCEFISALLNSSINIGLVGHYSFDQLRIIEGIPLPNVDYNRGFFPQEASLMNHISYKKGCYIGQETHARMYHRGHPNRQLAIIIIPNEISINRGDKIYQDCEESGVVTSVSSILHEEYYKGISLIKYYSIIRGKLFSASKHGRATIKCTPISK